MLRILFSILLLISGAAAQSPQRVATTTTKVTISTSNIFQQALPSASRNSCTLQYTGPNTGYVFFGPIANATTPTSFQLTYIQSINCGTFNGLVLTDQVNVSGTAGDSFVVTTQ